MNECYKIYKVKEDIICGVCAHVLEMKEIIENVTTVEDHRYMAGSIPKSCICDCCEAELFFDVFISPNHDVYFITGDGERIKNGSI